MNCKILLFTPLLFVIFLLIWLGCWRGRRSICTKVMELFEEACDEDGMDGQPQVTEEDQIDLYIKDATPQKDENGQDTHSEVLKGLFTELLREPPAGGIRNDSLAAMKTLFSRHGLWIRNLIIVDGNDDTGGEDGSVGRRSSMVTHVAAHFPPRNERLRHMEGAELRKFAVGKRTALIDIALTKVLGNNSEFELYTAEDEEETDGEET